MINKKRLVNSFIELVKIDSPSGEEKKFSLVLRDKLQKLGCKPYFDKYGNIIAKKDGKGLPFMLNSHMDTVEPGRNIEPKIVGNIIKSNGKTILGSDPKSGVAIILEVLESLKEDKKNHRPLEIVFTREEETSLGGALNLEYSKIKAKEGLVLDGDEEVYKVFISSPTYYALDVKITGRAAHAGVEPEKGISAIEIAAKIISSFKLGRIDHETTFNIGTINGGSVRNAVPETVTFEGEIRSRNPKTLSRILKSTKVIFEKTSKMYPEALIEYDLVKDFDGFKLTSKHPLIKKVIGRLKSLNFTPQLKNSGGGSDANVFFKNGIEVAIVGIGVYEPHTTREYLSISQMHEAAIFCETMTFVE